MTDTGTRVGGDDRAGSVRAEHEGEDSLTLVLEGRLDANSVGRLWRESLALVDGAGPVALVVEAAGVNYCDGSGTGLLLELKRRQLAAGREIEIRGLADEFASLLERFDPATIDGAPPSPPRRRVPEEVGRGMVEQLRELYDLIAFTGELAVALGRALVRPRRIRWRDAWLIAERTGVNALPIVGIIAFLMGLIMAFQSATFMAAYGVEIYVANLVALSMVRELGPLMTAVVLAGRSGSAFAAELGTMKVNEELDALATMGLDPVRFLVVTRVLAAVVMIPLLTVFADLIGVLGGFVVLKGMGFSATTYFLQVESTIDWVDFVGGLAKAVVFGLVVAGVGCRHGLRTRLGASAVGQSATSAVVSGIFFIVVLDGIFAIVYYHLGL